MAQGRRLKLRPTPPRCIAVAFGLSCGTGPPESAQAASRLCACCNTRGNPRSAVPSRLATLQPFVFPSRLQRQGWPHDGYSHPLISLAGLRARPSLPPRPRAGPINRGTALHAYACEGAVCCESSRPCVSPFCSRACACACACARARARAQARPSAPACAQARTHAFAGAAPRQRSWLRCSAFCSLPLLRRRPARLPRLTSGPAR